MSSEAEEEPGEFEVRQEPDDVRRFGAVLIGFIGLVTIGLCLVIAGAIWLGFIRARQSNFAVAPPAGTLERSLIEATKRAYDLDQEKKKELTRWGWVDRDAGVARVPIERAMELVATEEER